MSEKPAGGSRTESPATDEFAACAYMMCVSGSKLAPRNFRMRHYLFLSRQHAIEKYVQRTFDPEEVARGWSGWRVGLRPEMLRLPSSDELRIYDGDDTLDPDDPWTEHYTSSVRRQVEARQGSDRAGRGN